LDWQRQWLLQDVKRQHTGLIRMSTQEDLGSQWLVRMLLLTPFTQSTDILMNASPVIMSLNG
jgi:hypothetical protein